MRQIIAIIVFLSVVSAQAQVSVLGALDNNKILIGDQAVLHLEAKYPENYEVIGIDLSVLDSIIAEKNAQNPDPDPGQLEILQLENWDTLVHNGLVTLSRDVKLTAWKPGVYYVPPIIFRFQENKKLTQSKATNRLALLVDSPITDQTATDSIQLAPIKEIILEPLKFQDFLPYIIALAVLIGVIVLAIFLSKRFSKKEEYGKIKVRKRAAHEVAFEKLKHLKGAKLWQQGMIKEYQSELSHTIREYVENRYEIPALESTTGEILSDLMDKDFNEDLKSNLKEMLQLADLVKFAKAEPPVERHEQLMNFAEDFVLKTKKEIPEEEAFEEITVKRNGKRSAEFTSSPLGAGNHCSVYPNAIGGFLAEIFSSCNRHQFVWYIIFFGRFYISDDYKPGQSIGDGGGDYFSCYHLGVYSLWCILLCFYGVEKGLYDR